MSVLLGSLVIAGTSCRSQPPVEAPARTLVLPAATITAPTPPTAEPTSQPAASSAPSAAAAPIGGYPVDPRCREAGALVEEKRALPAKTEWTTVEGKAQRIEIRVPPKLFQVHQGPALVLTSSIKALELGEGAKSYHVFGLRFQRVAASINELLANKKPGSALADAYFDSAFPSGNEQSFTPSTEDRGSGSASRARIASKDAYSWVNGVEGYNTDWVLVPIDKNDTLVVRADWNSSIMVGQPECFQQLVIAGVLDSLVVH